MSTNPSRKNLIKAENLTKLLQMNWTNKACSIFQWKIHVEEKLIEDNDFISDQIERLLFEDGHCVIFRDDDGVLKVYRWAMTKGLNGYGQPVAWYVFGMNGQDRFERNIENSVLIWNDKYRYPTKGYVDFIIANKLVNIEMTIDQHLNAMKVPYIFSGEKSELLTFKNFYKKITEAEPVIYVNKSITEAGNFEVHNPQVVYIADKLQQLYNDYEGRILSHLGLQYVGIEKKERLITTEVNANNDNSDSTFVSRLTERKRATKLMKKVLNIDVEVKLNENYLPTKEEIEALKPDKKEGEKDVK